MSGTRTAIAAFLLIAAVLLGGSTAEAVDDLFRYKFPCEPADTCILTNAPNTGHNGAYDFVIVPPAGQSDNVPAVSEGTFSAYVTEAAECTWDTNPNDANAGIFARVNDIHGRTIIYAHLAGSGSLQPGQKVLQGDTIGLQGSTGRSEDCDEHLHLGWSSALGYMDGVDDMDLVNQHPHLQFPSTNSQIGVFNLPGLAIRDRFVASGGWGNVGWTAARSATAAGCPSSLTNCALYVHYVPDPAEGHWGSRMEFRRHPTDGYGAIMAGRWDVNSASWAWVPFYDAWRAGVVFEGLTRSIGVPLMDRIGQNALLCPAPCIAYQRFHVGYIQQTPANGVEAFFCPDVNPAYPNQDNSVAIGDILAVVAAFGTSDFNYDPWEAWANAWYDINGDGSLTITDIALVVAGFGVVCIGG